MYKFLFLRLFVTKVIKKDLVDICLHTVKVANRVEDIVLFSFKHYTFYHIIGY